MTKPIIAVLALLLCFASVAEAKGPRSRPRVAPTTELADTTSEVGKAGLVPGSAGTLPSVADAYAEGLAADVEKCVRLAQEAQAEISPAESSDTHDYRPACIAIVALEWDEFNNGD